MKLNHEQQELFDIGVDLYEVYEREELTGTIPFFATARKQLYKSVLSLAVTYHVLNEETIKRFEELGDYQKLLSTLPEDHLARSYYKGIQNMPPRIKECVTCDFKITMMHFWSLIEKALEKYKAEKLR
ncbi:hypothetical protein [Bacillus sp. AFS033286]|uniref:hypothetical protein n=1 Tax=Bacillus sp. AFS033286 TaxID=2033498 RepID=UPI000BFCCFCC|nr:hypothetical protein [Bacillus sp. AFS033286]PGX11851.1 hypothetical protein COE07_11310 [Bacillus sp. AFS033286]